MADMAEDYGWSMDDEDFFFVEEEPTPEERVAQARRMEEEAIGEVYASRYAFD